MTLLTGAVSAAEPARPPLHETPRWRHPVAAVWLNEGRTLCVANQRGGSLSLVDVSSGRVIDEFAVGDRLADIAILPDRRHVLTVDEQRHELVVVAHDRGRLQVKSRQPVSAYPVSLLVSPDGSLAVVASLWSRRFQTFTISAEDQSATGRARLLPSRVDRVSSRQEPRPPATSIDHICNLKLEHDIRLPFPPRRMLRLPGSDEVVVADAFGGQLAVVNTKSGEVVSRHEFDGHNIQGLALSVDGYRLLITNQLLNERSPITQDSIHWGETLRNVMSDVRLIDLRNPRLELRPHVGLTFLGSRGAGGGDPAGFVVLPTTDRVAVALAGLDQLAVFERGGLIVHRVPVGRRPLAVLPVRQSTSPPGSEGSGVRGGPNDDQRSPPAVVARSPDRATHAAKGFTTDTSDAGRSAVTNVAGPGDPATTAFIRQVITLNSLGDSLSVVDLPTGRVVREISLGPQPDLTGADRGERLFFDARLSHDGWLSCHSCHVNGHTNGLRADTLGDGSYGAPKRTPTLLGTALADKWGWSGSFQYLHEQIQKSLATTLHGDTLTPQNALDLAAYLHTLPAPPPLEPATRDEADRDQIARGRRVFTEHGCARCHVPPLTYTSHDTHDVGLADERGQTKFNAPSLRGVSQSRRFFHDNRAASLEDVFLEFNHPRGTVLTDEELADLLRFLRSL
jgi:DNA-binding beta-propeller fold protein YncE